MNMDMDIERDGIEETQPWKDNRGSGGAVKTTHVDGDVSVGMDVAIGGNTKMQGGALIKGNVKIHGWMIAHNIKGCYKGLFVTRQKLVEAYPHPFDGWWAIVGKAAPGPVYNGDGGEWVATGEIGLDPEDALNQATAKKYTDEKTAETLKAAKDYHDEHEEQLREEMDDAYRAIRGEMEDADRSIREDFAAADAGIVADYQAADKKITDGYKAGDTATLLGAKTYADAKDTEHIAELTKYSDDRDAEILAQARLYADQKTESSLYPVPVGTILIWPGPTEKIPIGYMECDGRALRKDEYAELYRILAEKYNAAKYFDSAGTETAHVSPGSDSFRLPDLRERFIVGYNVSSSEQTYRSVGNSGGEKRHKLTVSEMPKHDHQENVHKEANGDWKSGGKNSSPNSTTHHNQYEKKFLTEKTGGDQPHENRPPFYVMVYIIRVK